MKIDLKLNENEVLEDLGNNIFIIQNNNYFKFGIDAVLLADFVKKSIKRKSRVCEVGTGTGIIPLLLASKTTLTHIDAFEIQNELAQIAKRSVEYNNLENKVNIINQDIKEQNIFKPNSLDIIICNPPYFPKVDSKKEPTRVTVNPNETLAIARHEIKLTIEELFDFSFRYLRQGGKLFIIYRPTRFAEIISKAKERHLIAKRVRFIYPSINKEASMVLVEFSKNAKEYLIVEKPLIIYEGDNYTKEIIEIYGDNQSY